MRKNHLFIGAVATMLLLVGAGCPQGKLQSEIDLRADEVKSDSAIDASVDAMIQGEQTDDERIEGEANDVNADKMELDAYSESTYELK